MELETSAPFYLVGDDISCAECGRHLLHILPNGNFEHDNRIHLRIQGNEHDVAADGRKIGRVEDFTCLYCHPGRALEMLPDNLPSGLRQLLESVLGAPSPEAQIDARIKAPWEG